MENSNGKPRGIAFWNSHLIKFKASGLSANEYCRQTGLKRSSFQAYVRNELYKVPLTSQESFVEITPPVRDNTPHEATSHCFDVLSIRIPAGIPVAELVALVTALRQC